MAKKITPRFPDYKWYCVACHECLSDQPGFNDNKLYGEKVKSTLADVVESLEDGDGI